MPQSQDRRAWLTCWCLKGEYCSQTRSRNVLARGMSLVDQRSSPLRTLVNHFEREQGGRRNSGPCGRLRFSRRKRLYSGADPFQQEVRIAMEQRVLLAGLGPMTKASAVASMVRQAAPARKVEVLTTHPSYTGRQPQRGQRLILRRSRTLAQGLSAVAVETAAGSPLGYLPPAPAEVLARLLDHGLKASAEVIEAGQLRVFLHAE
ncbi:MAG: hypothetical protein FJX25_05345 [Alphaproteobacteria bacterium]|nr:hypothetical protein [Alphaproteobacteria bacterium]